jgi:hypothetical protein
VLPKGTRLGREERRLLLAAAPRGAGHGEPILPRTASPAAQTATRRATATLVDKGLVQITTPERVTDSAFLAVMRRRGYMRVRSMRRTALGERVVERHGEALRTGQRIRWEQ